MNFIALTTALLVFLLSALPFKPAEEFKLEIEYKFKARPMVENSFINLTETQLEKEKRAAGGNPLPYLIIHVSFLQLSDKEVKVRCIDNTNKNRLSRKAELNRKYTIDLGFTDDIKDRVTPHEYTFFLISDDKEETSRIVLLIEPDGSFMVNGSRRGKF